MMNHLCKILFIFIIIVSKPATAGWYDSDYVSNLSSSAMGCITPPSFDFMSSNTKSIDYTTTTWVDSGITAQSGKLVQIKWDTLNTNMSVADQTRKYRVLFKADPRFGRSQVSIARFDKNLSIYIWDFDEYRNGYFHGADSINALQNFLCSDAAAPDCLVRQSYLQNIQDYINFTDRNPIVLNPGDVVNITMLAPQDFFTNGLNKINDSPSTISRPPFADELPRFTLSSEVGNFNNGILYYNHQIAYATGDNVQYTNRVDNLIGLSNDASITTGLPSCAAGTTGLSGVACIYDGGRGMGIVAGGNVIKDGNTIFLMHNSKLMYYYQATSETTLDFIKVFSNAGLFSFADPTYLSECTLHANLLGQDVCNFDVNYLYLGRYLMEIEVGTGSNVTNTSNPSINLEYYISDTAPTDSTAGSLLPASFYKTDASQDGKLWFRVVDNNASAQIAGQVRISYYAYNGSNDFSQFINDYLVSPLRDTFYKLSKQLYTGILQDPGFTKSAKAMLTLYVIFYGLYFLAGGVKLSLSDLMERVVKIILIVVLLSEQSWDFFNNNLFNALLGGMDYLITSVVGYSSSSNNIFGFIDPILHRYLQPEFWGILFVYLVHLYNGLFIIGILLIVGTLSYLRVILEIIINYIIAMLTIFVLISIAPLFIIMILFSQTRHLFENWLSLLFNNMLQPTILLLMVLIIDQVISSQLSGAVVQVCWDILIPVKVNISLEHLIPGFIISFVPPFFPGIPFYVVKMGNLVASSTTTYYNVLNSAFIFFVFAKMSRGMIDFVSMLTAQLTNVMPARQEGAVNKPASVVEDIRQTLTGKNGMLGKGLNMAKRGGASVLSGVKAADIQAQKRVKDSMKNQEGREGKEGKDDKDGGKSDKDLPENKDSQK